MRYVYRVGWERINREAGPETGKRVIQYSDEIYSRAKARAFHKNMKEPSPYIGEAWIERRPQAKWERI